MQAQAAQPCFNCKAPLRGNAMRYLISDMADEMMAWVELKLKLGVNEHSCLCQKCFNNFQTTWAAIQEPEVDFTETMVQDFDPLMGSSRFNVEEAAVNFEEPEEPLSDQHYDYKIEIDTFEATATEPESHTKTSHDIETDCVNDENTTYDDIDDVKEAENDEKSSDYEPDIEELSSDDTNINVSIIPPVLDGSKLKSGTKCDWCKIVVKNKEYRMLPEGPEKDYIVTKTFTRELSPERVCNPCWHKAHVGAKLITKGPVQTRSHTPPPSSEHMATDDDQDVISIPSYRRFPNSASRCLIVDCKNSERHRIPDYLKSVLLKSYNMFVPDSARICQEHCKEYHRDWSFLKKQKYITTFSAKDVTAMLDLLREEALGYPE